MSADIRALSVHRPYAALILAGVKTVENRSWRTAYRGPLVIHAGKTCATLEDEQLDLLRDPNRLMMGMLPQAEPTGYVGIVQMFDVCREGQASTWTVGDCPCGTWALAGNYHWRLRLPIHFRPPFDGPGRQGLFRPTAEVAEHAAAAALYLAGAPS